MYCQFNSQRFWILSKLSCILVWLVTSSVMPAELQSVLDIPVAEFVTLLRFLERS